MNQYCELESYMVGEPMPIMCSGDCYWLLVCSGVLVCSGISTNRTIILLTDRLRR